MMKLLVAGFDAEIVEVIRYTLSSSGARAGSQQWGIRSPRWLTGRDYFDDLNRRVLELKTFLTDVYDAHDEQSTMKLLLREKPDAILIDSSIWASNMSIIERIRRDYDRLAILITGNGFDDQTINSAMEFGADEYITKPFGPRQLRARIKRSMEGKQ